MDHGRQDKDLAKFKNESRGLEGVASTAKAGWCGEQTNQKRRRSRAWRNSSAAASL